MIEEHAVFTSDGLTRYATFFTAGALASALRDRAEVDVPFLLGHDASRPLGWTQPTALHFEPGLTRLVGRILVPETDDDRQMLAAVNREYTSRMAAEHETELAQLMRLVETELDGEAQFVLKGCVAVVSPSIARQLAPEVFAEPDRDGLIDLARLTPIGAGVFRIGDLVLFAHPYLRRSQSRLNTLNQPFLARLQQLASGGTPIRVALDPDMVGLASSYHEYFEYQYWWGPKFNDDLASIPVGVTRHEASDRERLYFAISRTEFWWHDQDDQPTLEVEELRDIPSLREEHARYGCRYAHAIVDKDTGLVCHFDGAIRSYPEELMIQRLDASIAQFGRRSDYTKLWRVNAALTVSGWKWLLTDYFLDNRLVGDYLGAAPDDVMTETETQVEDLPPVRRYVPYAMNRGSGVQVAISLHPAQLDLQDERTIVPLDLLISSEQNLHIVESDVVELAKALQRRGATLGIPAQATIVSTKDFYTSLPLVVHRADAPAESVDVTFAAIRAIVQAWNDRQYDLIGAFAIGLPLGEVELRMAVLGHTDDLAAWLDQPISKPPASIDELAAWADDVTSWLFRQYPQGRISGHPYIFDVLMPTGVFSFQRKFVDQAATDFRFVPTEQGVAYEMQIPESLHSLGESLKQRELHVAMLFPVQRSTCSRCAGEYRSCSHSKLLDSGVYEEICDTGPWMPFWTDRPVLWPKVEAPLGPQESPLESN